jgi:hypothetical protein
MARARERKRRRRRRRKARVMIKKRERERRRRRMGDVHVDIPLIKVNLIKKMMKMIQNWWSMSQLKEIMKMSKR